MFILIFLIFNLFSVDFKDAPAGSFKFENTIDGILVKDDYRIEVKNFNLGDYDGLVFYAWTDDGPTDLRIIFSGQNLAFSKKFTVYNFKKPFAFIFTRLREREVWRKVKFITFSSDNKRNIYIKKLFISKGVNPQKDEIKIGNLVLGNTRAILLSERLMGFKKYEKIDVSDILFLDDKKLLLKIAEDTWEYFKDIVDKENSLPLDQIRYRPDMMIGDYCNVTDIGIYLMSLVSAYDLKFLRYEEVKNYVRNTIDRIKKLKKYKGLFFNYYDTTTGEPTSKFISFVDCGWLAYGLLITGETFSEFKKDCYELLESMDFSLFYDNNIGQMRHGYYVDKKEFAEYHYGILNTEARAISLLSIAKGDAPKEHWFRIYRVLPREWKWQNQIPEGKEITIMDVPVFEGYYRYKDMKIVPSWGGSMFEALMPSLVIDERRWAKRNLGRNNLLYVKAQIIHSKEKNYPVWGFTPCANPEGGYGEYGVSDIGSKGEEQGQYSDDVVSPYAVFLALDYAYKDCMEDIRTLLKKYPEIYGPYGFYDGVRIKNGHVAKSYLALDEGMILIPINNYLNKGIIRRRFEKSKYKWVLEILKYEDWRW